MARKDITDKELLIAKVNHGGLENGDPIQNLSEITGQCYKVCYRCYERAIGRGYMDYGVSIRTAWITPKGEELIK